MRNRIAPQIGVLAALFIGLSTTTGAWAEIEPLAFKRCTVTSSALEIDAQCADFVRHENPEDDNSRLITLSVIKFAAHSPEPETDAFTIIQGGPGASSIDMAIAYRSVFDDIRRKRDLLVIDQRGTGRSNKLACDLPEDESTEFDPAEVRRLTKECLDTLSAKADVRYYSTSVAVDDLEALRVAAGYTQLNVYGISYGTRVAQHYLRKYASSTRSVILDGVAPVGLNLAGGEIARRWQDTFESLNTRCQQDAECANKHGDLSSAFTQVVARLKAEPITVTVAHPSTGEPTEQDLNQYSLFNATRLMAYSSEQAALMPILLSQAQQGNYHFLAAQLLQMEDGIIDTFATGMHNSVVCTEDAPFVTPENLAKAEGTFVGSLMSDALAASCDVWPSGPLDDGFLTEFSSDVPVLILSGEADPITPPANGEQAANMLSNSKHIIVPAHGHGVIARGCVPKLASNFIDSVSFDDFDASCVERERAMPIFSNLTGPKP